MLPSRFLEKYLEKTPAHLQDIILELRNIIVAVAPGVTEKGMQRRLQLLLQGAGRPGQPRGFARSASTKTTSAWHSSMVEFLPDPKHLLEGEAIYKKFLRLRSYEEAPWEDLRDLITNSSRFDPRTLQFR